MTFRRAGTPVDPRRAATVLITHGPYRFTRNPAYLGMTLLYSGITLLRGALGATHGVSRAPRGSRSSLPTSPA